MEWDEFLRQIAIEHELSPDQTNVLVARLSDRNFGKSETKIADSLNMGFRSFKKHMGNVYELLEKTCSKLSEVKGRGRLEALRACLKHEHQRRFAPVSQHLNQPLNLEPPNNLDRQGILDAAKFIGRETELTNLHKLLSQNNTVAITAIAGMSGVGKTELAIQYARRHKMLYPGGICWLSAAGEQSTPEMLAKGTASKVVVELATIAPKWMSPETITIMQQLEEVTARVSYALQHWRSGDVLLIVDDVTDYATQVRPILTEDKRFKVLVTTRDRSLVSIRLNLDVLKPLAAFRLLQSLVGRARVAAEPWIARQLCRWLGYLPLGIELVGSYLAIEPHRSLEWMLQRLQRQKLDAPGLSNPERGVKAAFEITWERLDEVAQQYGMYLSLYAPAPIPLLSLDEDQLSDEQLAAVDQTNAALHRLMDLHLLQNKGNQTYQLHPLIREFLHTKLNTSGFADDSKRQFAAAILKIAEQIPQQLTLHQVQTLQLLIPHLEEVATHFLDWLEEATTLFTGIFRFYLGQALYNQAEVWCERCRDFTAQHLGEEHPDFANSLNNLALIYEAQGRYLEAEPLIEQSIGIFEQLPDGFQRYLANSLNTLAGIYELQGRYYEAALLCIRALKIRVQQLGGSHLEVANSLHNLAGIYQKQERHSRAELLIMRSLAIRMQKLGADHLSVASSLHSLANLYRAQKKYNKAESHYIQSLEIKLCHLGPIHPHVLIGIGEMAMLYQLQGRYSEAEKLYLSVSVILCDQVGENHSDTQIVRRNFIQFLEYVVQEGRTAELSGHPFVQDLVNEIQQEARK